MQTAMIWDSFGEQSLSFYLFEDDLSRFDGVFINLCAPVGGDTRTEEEYDALQQELMSLMYEEDGPQIQTPVSREEFVAAIKAGAKLIVAGFVP